MPNRLIKSKKFNDEFAKMRIRDRELLQIAERANKMFEDYSQWAAAQPLFDQVSDKLEFASLHRSRFGYWESSHKPTQSRSKSI